MRERMRSPRPCPGRTPQGVLQNAGNYQVDTMQPHEELAIQIAVLLDTHPETAAQVKNYLPASRLRELLQLPASGLARAVTDLTHNCATCLGCSGKLVNRSRISPESPRRHCPT